MQRDKEAVAALMRAKQAAGMFHSLTLVRPLWHRLHYSIIVTISMAPVLVSQLTDYLMT